MRVPGPIQELIDWLRYDLPRKRPRLPSLRGRLPSLPGLDRRWLLGGVVVLAAGVLIWALTSGPLGGDDEQEVETKVVTVPIETDDPSEAPVGPLGFPLVATRNTTRVGGPDPASDAAAVALATHPSTPTAVPTEAAVLVESGSPYAGLAASVLAGPPLRAPILLGDAGGLPEPTADALAKINPRGGSGPADAAVYLIGSVAEPGFGLQSERAANGSAAEIADQVDQLRARLIKAEAEHVLVVSGDDPAYAMPAAAWAARSGDPILFTGRDELPEATVEALRRHRGVPTYVLGPPSVISERAIDEIERTTGNAQRIGEEGPVANAIAFARYSDASFGWNINDPGHGLVLANTSRPLDAVASASLSASGKWGPLLLIENAATLPSELRTFLLDIKPGFEDDPTRAVYNHIWLIGDSSAIGGRVQAELDELAELAEVGSGAGGPIGETQDQGAASAGFAPPRSGPHAEPTPPTRGTP